jgi:hypothetical protein
MNRRLFTFGCSFTNYYLWPTWADLLGSDYELFFNWGHPGLGNKAIAERVVEAHARFRFTKDDIIIVQWTSHLRNDWMNFQMNKTDNSFWRTKGSIFSKENQKLYDRKWMMTFWDEKAYYLHTLNHILLCQGFLDSIGCDWFMTSMTDFGKINLEASARTVDGEIPDKDSKTFDVWEKTPEFLDYKNVIWDQRPDKWIKPMVEVSNEYSDEYWWFKHDPELEKDFNVYKGKWMEPHPSVMQHARWLSLLLEKLKSNSELSENQIMMVEHFNELKSQTETYRQFEFLVRQTPWYNGVMYRGY